MLGDFDEKKELELIVNFYSKKDDKHGLKAAVLNYAKRYNKQRRSGSNIESERSDGIPDIRNSRLLLGIS